MEASRKQAEAKVKASENKKTVITTSYVPPLLPDDQLLMEPQVCLMLGATTSGVHDH